MRYVILIALASLSACVSPLQEMKKDHPEFLAEVVGDWMLLPESTESPEQTITFTDQLAVVDAGKVICGADASPNYWSPRTPEKTVFELDQKNITQRGKGSVGLQKMRYERGMIMVVCSARTAYIDYIVRYGLTAEKAGYRGIHRNTKDVKFLNILAEDKSIRTFAYRRPQPRR